MIIFDYLHILSEECEVAYACPTVDLLNGNAIEQFVKIMWRNKFMRKHLKSISVIVIFAAGMVACSKTEKSEPASTDTGRGILSSVETDTGRDETFTVSNVATVEKVDYQNRIVTLRTSDNRTFEVKVGPEVKRLKEIKTGDKVEATYTAKLSFEVRPLTPAEIESPTNVMESYQRAPQANAPGQTYGREVQTVVTVTAIDRVAKTVTVKNPSGLTATVKAKNMERFDRMKVGDTAAVNISEAMNLSLEKK